MVLLYVLDLRVSKGEEVSLRGARAVKSRKLSRGTPQCQAILYKLQIRYKQSQWAHTEVWAQLEDIRVSD